MLSGQSTLPSHEGEGHAVSPTRAAFRAGGWRRGVVGCFSLVPPRGVPNGRSERGTWFRGSFPATVFPQENDFITSFHRARRKWCQTGPCAAQRGHPVRLGLQLGHHSGLACLCFFPTAGAEACRELGGRWRETGGETRRGVMRRTGTPVESRFRL